MDFSKVRYILFFAMLGGVSILFFLLLKPFFYPIFWAAVMATLFFPLYKRLLQHLKSPNLSASVTLVAVFLIIIIPLILLTSLVVREAINLYAAINDNSSSIQETVRNVFQVIKDNETLGRLQLDEQLATERLADVARTVLNFLILGLSTFTQNSIIFFIMFVIMMYTLFFFLRDGEGILKKIMHLCPLGDRNERVLYQKFTSTARATIKGTLIIGLIQGALGGLLFMAVGINGALIWGIIMVLLSVIPGLGAAIIYAPAGLILLATGGIWQGIVVLLFGALVISTSDNFLRPILVGKDVQIHPLLILFSTLGGIAVFGASGFVIGPVITALVLAFWEMYEQYYRSELDRNE